MIKKKSILKMKDIHVQRKMLTKTKIKKNQIV